MCRVYWLKVVLLRPNHIRTKGTNAVTRTNTDHVVGVEHGACSSQTSSQTIEVLSTSAGSQSEKGRDMLGPGRLVVKEGSDGRPWGSPHKEQ